MTATVAAVDLGATSGRVVRAEVGPATLRLEEVARFENRPVRIADGLHWSVPSLYDEAMRGVATASRMPGDASLASVAVDSWAVDYALLRRGSLLGIPFSYRDDRTARGLELVDRVIAQPQLYERCGLQRMPFTTINQLMVDRERGLLEVADRLLMLPDLFGYWMTGRMVAERTNVSTTGLMRLDEEWDTELMAMLGIPASLLAEVVDPGTRIGPIDAATRSHYGIEGAPDVFAVGSHDTASAVVAVPMEPGGAYVSSGTWSLVGIETEAPIATPAALDASFTNEGGVDGRTRFLKNVMGLWILSESMRTWQAAGERLGLPELLAAAAAVDWAVPVFDPTDDAFYPPGDMPSRIRSWFEERGQRPPQGRAEVVRCILESLAEGYARALRDAAAISGQSIERVHVVGGGARNALLCQLTADRTGLPVVAGPVEASAIGNVLVQARALGAAPASLEELRALVRATHELVEYRPRVR
ncbi:rhamnulokinase family protein [Agrococcus sp. TF02-05]|uniref:rhamnulokinase n=1 Tax=Agrococcus sp. TF02-05 TaxID=2815211 RepID=UPI001AA18701|nr:rhamnulokinase family protein [Agrococcus sp. TF02-05]MBO1770304.1 rhamnulokinase [Agrococcus sp. TF02-05]